MFSFKIIGGGALMLRGGPGPPWLPLGYGPVWAYASFWKWLQPPHAYSLKNPNNRLETEARQRH